MSKPLALLLAGAAIAQTAREQQKLRKALPQMEQ